MISIRKENPVLQSGVQIVRYADDRPGIFAISRVNPQKKEEMLAVYNNAAETRKANIKVFSPTGDWERVYPSKR